MSYWAEADNPGSTDNRIIECDGRQEVNRKERVGKVKDGGAECLGQQVKYLKQDSPHKVTIWTETWGLGVCHALGGRAFPNETSDEKVQRTTSAWQVQEWGQGVEEQEAGMCNQERHRAEPTDWQGVLVVTLITVTEFLQAQEACRLVPTPTPASGFTRSMTTSQYVKMAYRPTACLDGIRPRNVVFLYSLTATF